MSGRGKYIQVHFSEEDYKLILDAAYADQRSLSSWIRINLIKQAEIEGRKKNQPK